jgi:adenylosuccinate synthase
MSKLDVVVGGQFGSEAKGAVCARLVRLSLRRGLPANYIYVVRVAGHNAGHTAYDEQGRPWALRTIPVAAVVDPEVQLVIAAGSEVNPDVLMDEITRLEEGGIPIRGRLLVDRAATWLDEDHIATETGLQMHEKTGSTGKGVGAARAARAMRKARTIGEWADLPQWCVPTNDTAGMLNNLHFGSHVLLEGTQGYGLGLHTKYYPLVTSSNCRAIDFLAMAGVDPTGFDKYNVWVTLRRYPIRVAGPSGELVGETTWEGLGLPAEKTTVTKKVRRVGEWDPELANAAVQANGGSRVVKVAYTMADQSQPVLAGLDGSMFGDIGLTVAQERAISEEIARVEGATGLRPSLIGTGPNTMIEVSP